MPADPAFVVGQTIRMTATFKDSNRQPFNPSGVTFQYRVPGSSSATENSNPTNPETGTFFIDVDANVAGLWRCYVYTTAAGNKAAAKYQFAVTPSEV